MAKGKTLTETAIDFLRAGMAPVEEAFTGKRDEMGEVFVVFTWKKKDYRVSVRRFTEEDE